MQKVNLFSLRLDKRRIGFGRPLNPHCLVFRKASGPGDIVCIDVRNPGMRITAGPPHSAPYYLPREYKRGMSH